MLPVEGSELDTADAAAWLEWDRDEERTWAPATADGVA